MTDQSLDPRALDPRQVPAPYIEVIPEALIVPPTGDRGLPSGAFRPDGTFVEASRTLLTRHRLTREPSMPPDPPDALEGRYLYGGLGRSHFGHFLMEGMTRLWALDHDPGPLDGILFFPMPTRNLRRLLKGRYRPMLDPLCDALPLRVLTRPTFVGELVLPTQGMGHRDWIEGTPEMRAFLRRRFDTLGTIPDGPDKLYVSRSKVKTRADAVDQEDAIEAMMASAGYEIYHPQDHPIGHQAARYRAARLIVGPDGSAFHFAANILSAPSRVAILHRRHRPDVIGALVAQLRACTDAEITPIDALVPEGGDPPNALDLDRLRRGLQDAGFL